MSEPEVRYGYDVDVELVDGHRMTVHFEDASAGWYAAMTVGDHIVARARARIITPNCPKCWNSGIEREGFRRLATVVLEPSVEPPERRIVCDCAFGQQLLDNHEARRYTTDPIKADSDSELPDGARRAPGPDGRPLEGEWEVGPEPLLRLRMTYLASSPAGADDPAGGGSLKFELQGSGEGRRGTAMLYVTAPEWHALRLLKSTDELVVEVDEQTYQPPGTREQTPEELDATQARVDQIDAWAGEGRTDG